MHLTALRLINFRNHLDSSFAFGDGTNVLLGGNGHGKTNVIEAISYLCLTKSFYAGTDQVALSFGRERFEIEGFFLSEGGSSYRVRVSYSEAESEKSYKVNRQEIEPRSSVIGKFPVVIVSPEHAPITAGGPGERRRFVDFVISQSSAVYFQELLEYRKVLRHRNKILLDARSWRKDVSDILEPWTEQLVHLGAGLMFRRKQFAAEFQSFIASAYHHLVGSEEEPGIEYLPFARIGETQSVEDVKQVLRLELGAREDDERRLGTSLVGPHRDELRFTINNLDLRKFASQGQHKTFLVALKIGEFFYLKERCSETPLLLLDDVFTELDDHRSEQLLAFVGQLSQTFVSTTTTHVVDYLKHDDRNRVFYIRDGQNVEEELPVNA